MPLTVEVWFHLEPFSVWNGFIVDAIGANNVVALSLYDWTPRFVYDGESRLIRRELHGQMRRGRYDELVEFCRPQWERVAA